MTGRVAALVVALSLAGAATAEAGVYHGAVASAGTVVGCPANWTVVQLTGGNHQISSAGVVTKWFTFADAQGGQTRLVILRGSDPNYTVVGQSTDETAASGSNAFATRIPVASGDRIALTSSGGPCMFNSTGPSVHYCIGCNGGPGSMLVADQLQQDAQVNARVYVEQDGDGDGWGDESQDNCRGLPNPAQANNDADGSGDDCDIDDDNDSVLDIDDAFPFDARESSDADGDGVGDTADPDDDNDGASDVDEARAASLPGGAGPLPPPNLSVLPAEGALAAPVLRAPASVRLARLRKGVPVSATTESPARLDFELRGTPRGVRLARFEWVLASRALGAGSGRRSVRLKPSRRSLRGARRFTLQLRVTATDLGGNRAVATRRIRVRP